eukprot:CAMPEP_0117744826 /NCGR_PEP_ID=MMETSP0947-20121206/6995_1 /TAXON_ID=44440 /ORGANISM="Chattonella subsalsa, Strain CCMP2191" /LENGTH=533 /DNA_ID=CAMNT_0005561859 /DNA_START=68 /DNA_END=1669 /DNA_ORIENTATION=-
MRLLTILGLIFVLSDNGHRSISLIKTEHLAINSYIFASAISDFNGTDSYGTTLAAVPNVNVSEESTVQNESSSAFGGPATSSCNSELRMKTVYRNHTCDAMGLAIDSECSGNSVDFRVFEKTDDDRYYASLALEPSENRLYWTTRQEIVAADLDANTDSQVILMNGWISIIFSGYNLGYDINDIQEILVKGVHCGSIVYTSPNEVSCTSGHPTIVAWNGVDDDVSITTVSGGTGVGSSLVAEIRVKEGMLRPYVTKISVSTKTFSPHSVAVSTNLGRLYYSDNLLNEIGSCDSADGHNPSLVLSKFGPVHGMAIDDDARMLYLTDANNGRVTRLNLISGELEVLLSNLKEPRGITLDPLQNMMFVADSGNTIIQARMDGQNMNRNLVAQPYYKKEIHRAKSSARFDGIAVLPVSDGEQQFLPYDRRLYWCDTSQSAVYWSSIYGTQLEKLLSPEDTDITLLWPIAIAIDSLHQDLYFTEYLGKIYRRSINETSSSAALELLYETSYYTGEVLRYEMMKSRQEGKFEHMHLSTD